MVTLTTVPVTLPEDKVPTKDMIKQIISTFLPKEWPQVDSESLSMSYHESFANAHCPVERPKPSDGNPSEPLKVFIKFHKANVADLEIFKNLVPTKVQEAEVCYEYGQSRLGAKMYGFFQTQDGTLGRIDEFLDARNMEPEDVEDSSIRSDVATAFAAFHARDFSLPKTELKSYYRAITQGLSKYHKMDRLKTLGREGGVNVDKLVDFDFAARVGIVLDALESIGGKAAWCIHDVQFMNVMVKNNPTEGESKVFLIDFEFVMRNYRAFDIGGHFMQKLFKWFDEDSKLANCKSYTAEEKRHFCEQYAMEWNRVAGDADTGDQVLAEAEYGYMLAITFDIHNMLCYMNNEGDKDPLNLVGLNKLFEEFTKQYDRLGLALP